MIVIHILAFMGAIVFGICIGSICFGLPAALFNFSNKNIDRSMDIGAVTGSALCCYVVYLDIIGVI